MILLKHSLFVDLKSYLLGWQEIFCVFFSKFPRIVDKALEVFLLRIYKEVPVFSNNSKIIDMDINQELEMNLSHKELRVLLLHEFHLGRKSTQTARNICSTMGKDTHSIRTPQHGFNRFKSDNFELNDS